MKTLAVTWIVFLVCLSACNAGLVGWLTQEHQNWAFIESVGGMKVELKNKKLDVVCDVSGTRQVTTKPTTLNSGIDVRELKWTQVGNSIRLSVMTSAIGKGMQTSCGSIDLSKVPTGVYAVEYINRDGTTHLLRKIALP